MEYPSPARPGVATGPYAPGVTVSGQQHLRHITRLPRYCKADRHYCVVISPAGGKTAGGQGFWHTQSEPTGQTQASLLQSTVLSTSHRLVVFTTELRAFTTIPDETGRNILKTFTNLISDEAQSGGQL